MAMTRPQAIALAPDRALERPVLRGWLHLATAAAVVAGAALLLLLADSPTGYVGAAVFSTSLILLYGTSAT